MFPEPCNLYTDSHYVARAAPFLSHAYILTNDEELYHLFTGIQQLLRTRRNPTIISHIRAHTNLPGPLAKGNAIADSITHVYLLSITNLQKAEKIYASFHQNAAALR